MGKGQGELAVVLLDQAQVQGVDLIDHLLKAEVLANELASIAAEAFSQGGISREQQHPLAQFGSVTDRDQEPGLVLETHLRGAVRIIGDDGAAGGEGLGESPREALARR